MSPPWSSCRGGCAGAIGPCRKGRSGPRPLECCPAHPCRALIVAEILVLGTGDKVERLPPATLKQMRECGVAVEVQDTVRKGEHRQHPSEMEWVMYLVGKGRVSFLGAGTSLAPFSIHRRTHVQPSTS